MGIVTPFLSSLPSVRPLSRTPSLRMGIVTAWEVVAMRACRPVADTKPPHGHRHLYRLADKCNTRLASRTPSLRMGIVTVRFDNYDGKGLESRTPSLRMGIVTGRVLLRRIAGALSRTPSLRMGIVTEAPAGKKRR